MNYFKNDKNQVFAFDTEQVEQGYADAFSAITAAEAMAITNPPPTQEQLAQQAKSATYVLLDQIAQQYDYRNFNEVAQFITSGVWKAEAEALLAWQEAVWVKAYELLEQPLDSVQAFTDALPKFDGIE